MTHFGRGVNTGRDKSGKMLRSARLCENSVHGSTKLTTNAVVSLKIEYLSVRPEQRRRAPREFSHSLLLRMTLVELSS